MEYKLTKAALVAAAICFSSNAIGQDWTSGNETLYFNFDRAENKSGVDLTKVREALQNCSVSSISVTGHTDTTGSQAYNQPLSERRANVIKAEIVSWGLIDGNAITTRGAGESELALYTEDGVKEQLNRRAEVQFGFSQPCGQYYTAPVSDPVIYEPVSDPVIYEPVSEPVIYEPVSEPVIYEPVVSSPAPAPAPAPVVAAPTPPAPVAAPTPPAPVAVAGGALGSNTVLLGLGALGALGGLVAIIDDGGDGDDDDDQVPTSP